MPEQLKPSQESAFGEISPPANKDRSLVPPKIESSGQKMLEFQTETREENGIEGSFVLGED